MLKHCSHYRLGNGVPRTLPNPQIMILLALIIQLPRGEENRGITLIFLDSVMLLS